MPAADGAPYLALTDVEKSYGGVRALAGADLRISRAGVVHGLLGQNGSGKSTLLGVLSGQVRPDRGRIRLLGAEVALGSPQSALASGIAMVSQENATAPHLTVAENIMMGRRLVGRPYSVSWSRTWCRAQEALAALDLDYDPGWLVGRLRPDQRQMVEIARAMSTDARVLVLDEPTSSLSDYEVERLFAAVRRLSGRGVATIFVSHRLSEFFAIVDEVTVLRDGLTVAQGPVTEFDASSLVDAMVGEVEPAVRAVVASDTAPAAGALEIRGLVTTPDAPPVDLQVAPGEIVGLAGLSGSGRSELLECVFGARSASAGEVVVDGRSGAVRRPRAAIRAGLGYLPPDRKHQGLALNMSVADNLQMAATSRRFRLARPDARGAGRVAQVCQEMGVRSPSLAAPVAALSGGNQQKVALGKWLVADARYLLLDEPTRGVDAAAKVDIHHLLRELAGRGCGLLVSSSENDELLEFCDRIVVMFRGRVTAVLDAVEATESEVARLSGGLQ